MNPDDVIPMKFREAWAKFVPNGRKVTSDEVAKQILNYLVYDEMGGQITEEEKEYQYKEFVDMGNGKVTRERLKEFVSRIGWWPFGVSTEDSF